MKRLIFLLAACLPFCAAAADDQVSREILRIERASMDGWIKGNPDAMLASLDPDVTYIHVMTGKRIDGAAAVKALFEQYRGTPLFESYDMADPKVQVSGNVAVLTYQLVQRNGATANRWNGTLVYERKAGAWKVTHAHWSQAN